MRPNRLSPESKDKGVAAFRIANSQLVRRTDRRGLSSFDNSLSVGLYQAYELPRIVGPVEFYLVLSHAIFFAPSLRTCLSLRTWKSSQYSFHLRTGRLDPYFHIQLRTTKR